MPCQAGGAFLYVLSGISYSMSMHKGFIAC